MSRSATRRCSGRRRPDSSSLLGLRRRSRSVGGVELAGRVRLLDQDQRAVVRHLQVALALGEAHDVGLGLVEPQLGRVEHRQQRLVVGEDADRADRRPRRDHLDLVVEDLALGGQDLDRELLVGHGSYVVRPSFSVARRSSAPCLGLVVARTPPRPVVVGLLPRPVAAGILDDVVDRALQEERALGQVVVLAVEDLLEAADRSRRSGRTRPACR